jgi:thioredoxin reductase
VTTRDVVVVGGGPAGLAAATWLGRYRRDTVVLDSGEYRAASVESSHGYLARDPQDPMQFLQTAREQVAAYPTVSLQRGRAVDVRRDGTTFQVRTDGDVTIECLRLVLATGVVDACPDIEGFAEHYGASAFHCPACDGHEAEGREVVAYGWDERLVGFATSLLNWAKSVTVLTDGRRFDGDDACRSLLGRHGVEVVEVSARRMVGARGDLKGIELDDGRVLPASLLFFSVQHQPRTDLGVALGCRLDEDGYLDIDIDGRTSVEGVFAAGDVVPGLQLVQVAAAQGTAAGVAAALSLQGERGSPLSPTPAPDAAGELGADARNGPTSSSRSESDAGSVA